jgi:hypothetical protein
MSIISNLTKYARLVSDLRDFTRTTITLEQSRQMISNRLQNREINFLNLVQKGIFQNHNSPYLKLLKTAGCDFSDIESMVKKEGIESTLQTLMAKGVYFSWEEFKGKCQTIRGSEKFDFSIKDFDNPYLPNTYQVRSSRSRSAGTRTAFDLKHVLDKTAYCLPALAAYNATNYPAGLWIPILPSSAGLNAILQFLKTGVPILKWFTPVNESQLQSSFRDRVALRYIISSSRFWGRHIPHPEYVDLKNALIIAKWIANTKMQFGNCTLRSYPSLAITVCQAALEAGIDIKGTHFMVGGEPLTEAKLQKIRDAGASIGAHYFISEIGWIGCSCPQASAPGEVHLLHDSTALIQKSRIIEPMGMQINTFIFTNLLLSAPRILLNVESDDYGTVDSKECGCLFQELGFNHHISHIRSFSKLTGRGMTILGTDLIRILEQVLPEKFGGASTDYQLLEEENSIGETHLNLIISPQIGELNNNEVVEIILKELKQGIHGGKLASAIWSQMEAIKVKREYPRSKSGKIIPLYLEKIR